MNLYMLVRTTLCALPFACMFFYKHFYDRFVGTCQYVEKADWYEGCDKHIVAEEYRSRKLGNK